MTETVKDVFDTLLEAHRKIVQQAYGDGDYVFGTSQLDNYIDGWKDRFAKSVTVEKGSRSTTLTEKQKKCPYCHPDGGNGSGSLLPHTEKGSIAAVDPSGARLVVNIRGEQTAISITNCPMCGWKLEG